MDVNSHLSDQGIGDRELGECITDNGEMADADKSHAELRERADTASELADGNEAFGITNLCPELPGCS